MDHLWSTHASTKFNTKFNFKTSSISAYIKLFNQKTKISKICFLKFAKIAKSRNKYSALGEPKLKGYCVSPLSRSLGVGKFMPDEWHCGIEVEGGDTSHDVGER